MPLKKTSGNMYDWVTHTHSHLGGECPHRCSYCYTQQNKFGVAPRYQGKIRLIEKELLVKYDEKTLKKDGGIYPGIIFIEHMNDLFADEVDYKIIGRVMEHCRKHSDNTYVFQTKNPLRAFEFISIFPPKYIIGTTIESNRSYNISRAPFPDARFQGIKNFSMCGVDTFITIEPVMDFDVDTFAEKIIQAKPSFINIGGVKVAI